MCAALRLIFFVTVSAMWCQESFGQFDLAKFEEELLTQDPQSGEFTFHISAYCQAAAAYAALDEAARTERLTKLAQRCDAARLHGTLSILCQILFARHERPKLGAPYRSIVDVHAYYTLAEPLAFAENMPIYIARGYSGSGRFEGNQEYLARCLKTRKWAAEVFDASDRKNCERIMRSFIQNSRHEITAEEEAYLLKQLP